MALPESFQIALQRAQTERRLEQEQILERIGDTVRRGVPLLSGVVAGALSRSPIIGIGAAFVADKLQQRSEEKREQRRASRLEMRQRREAAKILAAQNEDMSFKEAMRLIEKNAIEKQKELDKQREQQLLDQFDVGEKQKQIVEQQAEQIGEPVQAQDQVISSTLEDTFMRIDENITGILDLLVEKFGSDEQRAERAAARQAFLDARRREELAEIARNVLPRRDVGEPERIPEEDSGPSFLSRVGSFLANLLTSKFILLPVAAGLALIFAKPLGELYEKYFGPNGKFRPELDAIGDAISRRVDEAKDFLKKKLEELLDRFLEDLPPAIASAVKKAILGDDEQPEPIPNEGFSEEELARLSRLNRGAELRGVRPPLLPQSLSTPRVQSAFQAVQGLLDGDSRNLVQIPQTSTTTQNRPPSFFSDRGLNIDDLARDFRLGAFGTGALGPLLPYTFTPSPLLPEVGRGDSGLPLGAENVIRDTIKVYSLLNMTLDEAYEGIKGQVDRLFDARINQEAVDDALDLVNPQSNLGANLSTVSGNQNALAVNQIIMPQSQSSTSIVNQRTTNMNGTAISPYAPEYKHPANSSRTMVG